MMQDKDWSKIILVLLWIPFAIAGWFTGYVVGAVVEAFKDGADHWDWK